MTFYAQSSSSSPATEPTHKRSIVYLLLITVAVGVGLIFMTDREKPPVSEKLSGSTLAQQLLQKGTLSPYSTAPQRSLPEQFSILGTVDEQYTIGQNPKTGESLIHNALGGIGGIVAFRGDRAALAKEMVSLDTYAEQNKHSLPRDAYDWFKSIARAGIRLAFGAPGAPYEAQGEMKQNLLSAFHHLSVNPTKSILQSEKYLELEQMFQKPEEVYQNPNTTTSNFLQPDSIYNPTASITSIWSPNLIPKTDTLASRLNCLILEPPYAALAATYGSYNYGSYNYDSTDE